MLNKILGLGAFSALLCTACLVPQDNNGVDCGDGDAVSIEGADYCVYASALLVENGFECPAGMEKAELRGHVAACGPPEAKESDLIEVYKNHKGTNPDQWPSGSCVTAADCDSGRGEGLCLDGECAYPIRPMCADGEMSVVSESECLQDDATCYELGDGTWCTGPASASACAPGEMSVATQSECLQDDATCYQLADGSWCTGPDAPACPADSQARPTACPDNDLTCFVFSESLSCDRQVCPEGWMSTEMGCPQDIGCLELVSGVTCIE